MQVIAIILLFFFVIMPVYSLVDIVGKENAVDAYFGLIPLFFICCIVIALIRVLYNARRKNNSLDQPSHLGIENHLLGNNDASIKENTPFVNDESSAISNVSVSPKKTGKRISLYEALRLPGDPDPDVGTEPIYVDCADTVSPKSTNGQFVDFSGVVDVDEFETDFDDIDEFDEFETDFDTEGEGDDDNNDIFAAFAVDDIFSEDDNHESNGYEDDDDYSWETHCEYCGELLEFCVCDHKHESHEALSIFNCDCDDDEGWGSSSRDDDDDDDSRLCDFDEFRSL